MSNSPQLPPETIAWLQQSASIHGNTYSQAILHILARLEYLEATQHAHIDIPLDDLAGIAELGVIEANARNPGLLTAAKAHQIASTETMEKVKNAQKLISEGGTLAEALEMMGIDGAIAQLLEAFAEESACSRSVTRLLADADQRLALMEVSCAEAIEQAVAMSEDRGRLLERQWVLGLVGMLLDGLQEGAGVVVLQSLRRMVEEGPPRQDGPTMQIDAND